MPHLREHQGPPVRNSPEEIDLVVIFGYIRSFFRGLQNRVNYTIEAIRKHALLFIVIILTGLGLGYLSYYRTKPFYTSTMTMMLANIRNEFIEDQLRNLTIMVDEGNLPAIAKRLDISIETASQIREMTFYNLDQNRIEEDSVLIGSPFQVKLSLYDNNSFEVMEPAIVNFLENNRYFSKQKLIKQRRITNVISKLKEEIASIDSMKTTIGKPQGPVNGFVYGQPIDPVNLYRESIDMYKQQVGLEADIERLDNVEIVTGFAPRLKPTGPKLWQYLTTGGLIAFLIGLVIALSLEAKRRKSGYHTTV